MKANSLLLAVYTLVIVFLLASVIHSGYVYQFDPDEFFHGNVVYLLQHGLVPYRDFFITYLPIYHWFLTPVSYVSGFTFHFFELSRTVMIVLFLIRTLFIFLIARKLFGPLVAYLSIALYLFDPFTVFSGMQIRPDNLMMTLYIAGIFFLLRWYLDKKTSALLWAGLLLGTSVMTLIKNIPATFLVVAFILSELHKTGRYRRMAQVTLMLILPAVLIAAWAGFKGIIPSLIQQVAFDAKHLNDALRYPQNILNYYWPPNLALYGFPGRPVTWAYELCLPLLAFAGMFTAFLNTRSYGTKRRFFSWFTAACFLQWVSLLFVRSVFLQYFLPVSWFLALFAASSLHTAYQKLCVTQLSKYSAIGIGLVILTGGLVISWSANNTRSAMSYAPQALYLETQWHTIPDTAAVFPGAVFRVSIYPLGYETNFVDTSSRLIERYGSPSVYLKRYRIPFILIDPFNFSFLDAPTRDYIKAHYQQNQKDHNMWILRS